MTQQPLIPKAKLQAIREKIIEANPDIANSYEFRKWQTVTLPDVLLAGREVAGRKGLSHELLDKEILLNWDLLEGSLHNQTPANIEALHAILCT